MGARFEFHSRWSVDAPPNDVYAALNDIESYPRWWRDVRSVQLVQEDRAHTTVRALLPYTLRFTMTREVSDPRAGLLRVRLDGDLDGYSQWTVRLSARGSDLVFEQQVQLRKQPLRTLAPVLRPLFTANHSFMMARGRRGLAAYLAR